MLITKKSENLLAEQLCIDHVGQWPKKTTFLFSEQTNMDSN